MTYFPVKLSLAFLLLFSTTVALSEKSTIPAKASDKMTLFKVESDVGENSTNIILSFNKDITWKNAKLEAHGSFVQMAMPNTFVPNSGQFSDVKSETVKKTVAYQSGLEDGTLRIFVNGKAEDILKNMKADVLGDKVIISYKNTASSAPVAATAAMLSKPIANAQQPEAAKDLLQGKLLTASIFCAIMLVGLLGVYFVRPFFKRRVKSAEVSIESMKTLSFHALSPKQKLALVQVGQEKILLGLSNDQMTYIKTVGEKPTQVSHAVHQNEPVAHRSSPQNAIRKAVHAARKATPVSAQTQAPTAKFQSEPQRTKAPATEQSRAERIVESDESGTNVQLSQPRSLVRKEEADEQNAVSDIKRLIRDKLRQMPQIS